jgi:hypothetical protein
MRRKRKKKRKKTWCRDHIGPLFVRKTKNKNGRDCERGVVGQNGKVEHKKTGKARERRFEVPPKIRSSDKIRERLKKEWTGTD